jgi:hypothetical protein
MGGFPVGCRMSPTPAEHKTTKRKRTIFRDLSSAYPSDLYCSEKGQLNSTPTAQLYQNFTAILVFMV